MERFMECKARLDVLKNTHSGCSKALRCGAAAVVRNCFGTLFIVLFTVLLVFSTNASAVVWPDIALLKETGGISNPVHVTHEGDGSRRLFIVEQAGRRKIMRAGVISPLPFLDITGKVAFGGEQGLLSVAFPPGFASSKRFYVNYTRKNDGATVIARYHVTPAPDIADPASEEIILVIQQPFANHNGGLVVFGPDGYLYVGMGDGGSGGDPLNNGQSKTTLLGKMLRIDVESGVPTYTVPSSNPFLQTPAALPEIWAIGLRNPWRFSFDRGTGDLYIADVGQNLFEKVDFQPASSTGGENYGWNIMEASHCYVNQTCNMTGLVLPVAEYPHLNGDCSITGGMVYRGLKYPGMTGTYLYGDYCTGRIRGLKKEAGLFENTVLLDSPFLIHIISARRRLWSPSNAAVTSVSQLSHGVQRDTVSSTSSMFPSTIRNALTTGFSVSIRLTII